MEGLQLQMLITAIYMVVVMRVVMEMKRNTEKKRHNSQLEVQWQKWLMTTLLDVTIKEMLRI